MKEPRKFIAALLIAYMVGSVFFTFDNISDKKTPEQITGTATGTVSITILSHAVQGPENFTAFVKEDNKKIGLNWSNATSALYYNIYYGSNLDDLIKINISNLSPNITKINNSQNNNWTDNSADSVIERYYRVSAVGSINEELSPKIVGKYTYIFYGTNNPSNAHRDENWMSIPFNLSFTAESFMDGVIGNSEKLTKLIRANNSSYQFYTHVHNLNDGKNFNMILGEGYAIFVNQTTNYTVAGDVLLEGLSYRFQGLTNPSNAHRAENWIGLPFNASNYAEDFLDKVGINSEKISKLIRQDNTNYQFYTHIHNLNDGKNFLMRTMQGYAVFVNQTTNYTTG